MPESYSTGSINAAEGSKVRSIAGRVRPAAPLTVFDAVFLSLRLYARIYFAFQFEARCSVKLELLHGIRLREKGAEKRVQKRRNIGALHSET